MSVVVALFKNFDLFSRLFVICLCVFCIVSFFNFFDFFFFFFFKYISFYVDLKPKCISNRAFSVITITISWLKYPILYNVIYKITVARIENLKMCSASGGSHPLTPCLQIFFPSYATDLCAYMRF